MSKAAEYLLTLQKDDFRILQAIEVGMRTSEYVSVESIITVSKLSLNQISDKLDNLHYNELIFRWKGVFTGYQLTQHGYDVLALHVLAERDTIIAIGKEIGRGKESDVYLAFNKEQKKLAAKIHRVGRPSFQKSKKLRSYIGGRGHINWLYKSRLSAEREFEALKIANKIKVKTPKAIDVNRHIVIMEYFEGIELAKIIQLKNPMKIFDGIISEIKKLFVLGKIIHADLSDYNIIITPNEDFLLIDFPQYEPITHKNRDELLFRDVSNICQFFKRKYRFQADPKDICETIIAEHMKRAKKEK